MADDLRERIRSGDLEAFDDPALELHQLAEPGAAWWTEGLSRLSFQVARRLGMELPYEQRQLALAATEELPTGTPRNMAFARACRALLASVPAELDAALAVLERHVPREETSPSAPPFPGR